MIDVSSSAWAIPHRIEMWKGSTDSLSALRPSQGSAGFYWVALSILQHQMMLDKYPLRHQSAFLFAVLKFYRAFLVATDH